jgi:hypothetical protein
VPVPATLADRSEVSGVCSAGGGPGVLLDGHCVPITVVDGGWGDPSSLPAASAAGVDFVVALTHAGKRGAALTVTDRASGKLRTRVKLGDCSLRSSVVYGAVGGVASAFVQLVCGTYGGGDLEDSLLRVDGKGDVTRVALPWDTDGLLTLVPGPRPLLFAVFNGQGTVALDARSLSWLAGWSVMGGWFNATTLGASPSPDGRWVAVPDPYGGVVDFVRLSDLTLQASVGVGKVGGGPGVIEWTAAGLTVTTFELPYE